MTLGFIAGVVYLVAHVVLLGGFWIFLAVADFARRSTGTQEPPTEKASWWLGQGTSRKKPNTFMIIAGLPLVIAMAVVIFGLFAGMGLVALQGVSSLAARIVPETVVLVIAGIGVSLYWNLFQVSPLIQELGGLFRSWRKAILAQAVLAAVVAVSFTYIYPPNRHPPLTLPNPLPKSDEELEKLKDLLANGKGIVAKWYYKDTPGGSFESDIYSTRPGPLGKDSLHREHIKMPGAPVRFEVLQYSVDGQVYDTEQAGGGVGFGPFDMSTSVKGLNLAVARRVMDAAKDQLTSVTRDGMPFSPQLPHPIVYHTKQPTLVFWGSKEQLTERIRALETIAGRRN